MTRTMEQGLKVGAVALLGVVGSLAAIRLVRRRRRTYAIRHRIKWGLMAAAAQFAARRFARRALMPMAS